MTNIDSPHSQSSVGTCEPTTKREGTVHLLSGLHSQSSLHREIRQLTELKHQPRIPGVPGYFSGCSQTGIFPAMLTFLLPGH